MYPISADGKAKAGPPTPRGEAAARNEFPFFLGRMHDAFDRLFERFESEWPLAEADGWPWPMDVEETEDTVFVRTRAPGLEAGDFAVEVHDTYLTLSASWLEEAAGGCVPKRRDCCEAILLPPGVDEEKVTARYKGSVLTVTVPLKPESRGRSVPVQSE
jgi:HSP20 family molecular chaperone IbpA